MTNAEIKEREILQKRGIVPQRLRNYETTGKFHQTYLARHPVEAEDVCLCCGKPLKHTTTTAEVFCSSVCKNK